jgi:hypothetical protein
MKIEKLKISSNFSWQEVKDKLKAYKQSDTYMQHSYCLAYNGLYIYFQFNKGETQLLKISVGNDQKKKTAVTFHHFDVSIKSFITNTLTKGN